MGVFDKIGKILSGDLFKNATNLIDEVVTSKEEKEQLRQSFQKLINDHEKEMEALIIQDRQGAREMYKEDSGLQKVYAMTFLVAYIALTLIMLYGAYQMAVEGVDLKEWVISLVSSIWGAMSTKVNTITDFLFGGSKPSNQQSKH